MRLIGFFLGFFFQKEYSAPPENAQREHFTLNVLSVPGEVLKGRPYQFVDHFSPE